jgi:uncharacterized protein (TIGR04255 family)
MSATRRRPVPPLQLKTNPLICVLSQVVIAPILQMGQYIPAIQERLRKSGFPLFRMEETQEVELGPQAALKLGARWLFYDKDERLAAIIAPNFIALQTNQYFSFDPFTEKLANLLTVVGEEADVKLCQRIGLRFVNLIPVSPNKSFEFYIRRELHGINGASLGVSKSASRMETVGTTPLGRLLVRLHSDTATNVLPKDLDPAGLSYPGIEKNGRRVVLDVDHFSVEKRDFNVPALIDGMWDLHEYTDKAFRAAVTDEALKLWEKEEAA